MCCLFGEVRTRQRVLASAAEPFREAGDKHRAGGTEQARAVIGETRIGGGDP